MTRDHKAEALASPNWRWVPGMRWVVRRGAPLEDYFGCIPYHSRPSLIPSAVPDWTDPATLGCLLHRVRELWESPTAYARQDGTILLDGREVPAWAIGDVWVSEVAATALGVKRGSLGIWGYPTEAEALCAALVAAPRLLRPEVPRPDRD